VKLPDKRWCSLACAGLLVLPASARALDTRASYSATIVQGKRSTPVGVLAFDLDHDVPFSSCAYFYGWDNATAEASAQGYVDEIKTLAHRGCVDNSLANFPTIILLDNAFPACGFDASQNPRTVFAMTLGETSQGVLSGTVQLTSATAVVNSIVMRPWA
jgi:hypothetical protein